MSITIVSAPPKSAPAQAPAPDASSDVAAGQDFANLLLGQLAIDVAPTLAVSLTEAPAADAAPTADAPADAAALLAALGLGTPQAKADAALPGSGQTEKTTTAPLSALPASTAASLKAQAPAIPLKAEPTLDAGLAEDKAAKFAVAAVGAPVEESVITKNPVADSPLTASPAPTTVGHVSNVPQHRDTTLALPTPVRDQNWASDFGQKIVWLASNDKQSAQLTLNPPQMGPIEISLNVDKGNASVSFASANAEVRDAIETALPRLREMFASAGIELGQTNVGAESFSQQQAGNDGKNPSSSRWMSDNAILGAETAGALQARAFGTQQGNGMVDIFA